MKFNAVFRNKINEDTLCKSLLMNFLALILSCMKHSKENPSAKIIVITRFIKLPLKTVCEVSLQVLFNNIITRNKF